MQLAARDTTTHATPLATPWTASSVPAGEAATVTATAEVLPESGYMRGHFPDLTIFPGVFMLELAVRAVLAEFDPDGAVAYDVLHVRSMRFVAPLLLGDTVDMVAEVARGDGLAVDARFTGSAGTEAARIVFTLRSGHG